jgi:hemolysin-activating ACP:hemolysin acyltransferase
MIPETRAWFYQVAKQIIPSLKPENMICGYDTRGYKPDAFMKNAYLNSVYTRIADQYEKT